MMRVAGIKSAGVAGAVRCAWLQGRRGLFAARRTLAVGGADKTEGEKHVQPRRAVGIDLGTTQSCVAVLENGEPIVVADEDGHRTTPSIVAYTEDGSLLTGHPAKRQQGINPAGTYSAVKRLIGRKFNDPQVTTVQEQSSYAVVQADNGDAWLKVPNVKAGKDSVSPVEVGGHVVQRMKAVAEKHLGHDIEEAVITVPAYFNDNQRQATKNAGQLAGLNVLRCVNEPTAAALAYGIAAVNKESSSNNKGAAKKVAVYDLGGGTFDISILSLDAFGVFEVLATNGDTFLGGEDVDAAIAQHLTNAFCEQHSVSRDELDTTALQRIKDAAEQAKIDLDDSEATTVLLPLLFNRKTLELRLTREEVDGLTRSVIQRTVNPCRKCMRDAAVKPQDLDHVLLVGGMTQMPLVQEIVGQTFKQEPLKGVNPLEAVAKGAAIQAGVLVGEVRDVLLLDVTPLSLGIETLGGMFNKLIPRNTSIPTSMTETFSTGVDNQTQVVIRVMQGERPIADDNQFLGEFVLMDIPPGPKGKAQIAVTFNIDADGIVRVSAVEKSSGREEHIEVRSTGGLTPEQVEALVEEAAQQRMRDEQRQQHLQALSELDIVVRDVESNVDQFEPQLDTKGVTAIRQRAKDLQDRIAACHKAADTAADAKATTDPGAAGTTSVQGGSVEEEIADLRERTETFAQDAMAMFQAAAAKSLNEGKGSSSPGNGSTEK